MILNYVTFWLLIQLCCYLHDFANGLFTLFCTLYSGISVTLFTVHLMEICCFCFRLFPSEKYRYLKNAKLKISSINVQDNGVYSCTAQNLAGMVQSTDNFILNIRGKLYNIKQIFYFCVTVCLPFICLCEEWLRWWLC